MDTITNRWVEGMNGKEVIDKNIKSGEVRDRRRYCSETIIQI